MTSHATRLKDQNIVATARSKRVMHHTKIDPATTLAIGCAAGVQPSGRFVASGCQAASMRSCSRQLPGTAQNASRRFFRKRTKQNDRPMPLRAELIGTL
jgi:hypothetical protein